MNPNEPASQNQQQPDKYDNPLEVMSPGEKVLCEIKRHPFGLFGIYLTGGFVIVLILVGAIVAPHYLTSVTSADKAGIFAVALLVTVIALLYLWVATMIYNGNRWIVTSDSITQISQAGLFRKQTSQLSLANLEDVTFEQNSMIQTMFGFGNLRVETAGERSKFQFPFCPKPAEYAREIIRAHEDFIQAHPEEGQTASPGTYGQQQASQQQTQAQPYQQPYGSPTQQSSYSQPSDEHQANDPTQQ